MLIVHISVHQRREAPKQWFRDEGLGKRLWGSALDQRRPTCMWQVTNLPPIWLCKIFVWESYYPEISTQQDRKGKINSQDPSYRSTLVFTQYLFIPSSQHNRCSSVLRHYHSLKKAKKIVFPSLPSPVISDVCHARQGEEVESRALVGEECNYPKASWQASTSSFQLSCSDHRLGARGTWTRLKKWKQTDGYL